MSWPLVGRGAELARFGEALSAPQTSGAVFVGGAGVGKTRLGKEALALAEAMGWAVRWATATRSAASIPFSALADVLSGVRMDGGNRFELLRRMVATLVTASGGLRLVLGVDDGHLLDDASGALVHQLAATFSAFVVVTVRSGEATPDSVTALWKDGSPSA